ncbi:MAG: hypothetical protein IT553_11280 [Sphingomonadaceae bacterium]|nr:hypothetical protein [Sphingomonadaceae bacterium]
MRDFDIGSATSSAVAFVSDHLRLILLLLGGAILVGQILVFVMIGTSVEAVAQQIGSAVTSGDASQLLQIGGGLMAASLVATLLQTTAQFAIYRIALSDEQDLGSAIGYGTNAAIIYLLFNFAVVAVAILFLALPIVAVVGVGSAAGGDSVSTGTVLVVLLLALAALPLMTWLVARLSVAIPAMADARSINPIFGLVQSWKLTRARQWPIVGFVLLYAVAAGILQVVLGLFGALFVMALGPTVGGIFSGALVAVPAAILGIAAAYGAYDRLRPDDAGDIFA